MKLLGKTLNFKYMKVYLNKNDATEELSILAPWKIGQTLWRTKVGQPLKM